MNFLARLYREGGRYDEAIPVTEGLLELRRKVLGAETSHTTWAQAQLLSYYEKAGREADAEALREEAAKRKAGQEKKAAPKDEGKTPEPAKDKPPLAEDE